MLSGSNDSKLTSQQVDPKVVPLYQVWQELVHVQTLDVYQYRVLTSFSALKELLSVIKKTQQGLFTTDDIKHKAGRSMTCQPCVMYPPDILCLHTFSQIILGSFQRRRPVSSKNSAFYRLSFPAASSIRSNSLAATLRG